MNPKAKLWVLALGGMALGAGPLSAQPAITDQPASQRVFAGSNVTLSIGVSGTGPLSYQWQFHGTNLPNGLIQTTAGTSSASYSGDGGAATSASLNWPMGVSLDASGSWYVADRYNNRIRKVDTTGRIGTVAGNGTAGFSGDGGPAVNASLNLPWGVTADYSANVYVADKGNNCVRKVSTNGVISTVAGNGTNGFSGDGGPAVNAKLSSPYCVAVDVAGNLYISDTSNERVRRVDTNGVITTVAGNGSAGYSGDGGWATNAALYSPIGLALDGAGNLFIADALNNRVRRVDTNGVITTAAGKASSGYSGDGGAATNATLYNPSGVALSSFGDLYIADTGDYRVRKVNTNGIITTVAGKGTSTYSGDGGAATNAGLPSPYGLAVDPIGNLYLADAAAQRIRQVLSYAAYPALYLPNVGVRDAGDYTVIVTSPSGSVTSEVATVTVDSPPVIVSPPVNQSAWVGTAASFDVDVGGTTPFGYYWFFNQTNLVAASTNSNLAILSATTNDAGSYAVVITNVYGSTTSAVVLLTVNQLVSEPVGQTVLAGGPVTLSVGVLGGGALHYQWQFNGTNLPNNIIRTVVGQSRAGFAGDGGPATNALVGWPGRLRFDLYGNLFIADTDNNRIRKVDTQGLITTVAGNGTRWDSGDGGAATNASLNTPNGVAWDAAGNLYIGDYTHVRRVDTSGLISNFAGNGTTAYSGSGGQATNAGVWNASDVAIDGPGRLFIAEWHNGVITVVETNGFISAVLTGLNHPSEVIVDPGGNLLFTEDLNNRVRKLDTHGVLTTIAGNGSGSYSGDGGPAINASLHSPQALALDSQGNLFIADFDNYRVRKVDTNGIITTVAGNGTFGQTGDGGAATNAPLAYPSGVAVDAAGNVFIGDGGSGLGHVREVALAGLPTLTLNNPGLSDSGNYQVIISSTSGNVTSQLATLTVQVRPAITSIVPQPDGTVALSLTGTPDSTNRVWATTNLTAPVAWSVLSTNVAGPDGTWQCTDTNTAGSTVRFYRASMP